MEYVDIGFVTNYKKGENDEKTLDDIRFVTGDFIDVSITHVPKERFRDRGDNRGDRDRIDRDRGDRDRDRGRDFRDRDFRDRDFDRDRDRNMRRGRDRDDKRR